MNTDGAVRIDLEDVLKVIFTEEQIATLKKKIEEEYRQRQIADRYKLLKLPHEYRIDYADVTLTINKKELKKAFTTRATLKSFIENVRCRAEREAAMKAIYSEKGGE